MRRIAASLALLSVISLGGCALSPSSGFAPEMAPAEIAHEKGAEGVHVTVGSKNFTEGLVLGKLAVIALRAAGYQVTDMTGMPGSQSARQAHTTGAVDFEFEYTGTAWTIYLGGKGVANRQKQYELVREADKKNGLTWLPPAPMNNTYGFAVRQADKTHLRTLSDVAALDPETLTICADPEFFSRDDGLQPALAHYGLKLGENLPRSNIKLMDQGAMFQALADGQCKVGEVMSTDGRIMALHLATLEDDKGYFPNYAVAPVIATAKLRESPAIAEVFSRITPKLTTKALQRMNAAVDVEGEDPANVAAKWLQSQGLVAKK